MSGTDWLVYTNPDCWVLMDNKLKMLSTVKEQIGWLRTGLQVVWVKGRWMSTLDCPEIWINHGSWYGGEVPVQAVRSVFRGMALCQGPAPHLMSQEVQFLMQNAPVTDWRPGSARTHWGAYSAPKPLNWSAVERRRAGKKGRRTKWGGRRRKKGKKGWERKDRGRRSGKGREILLPCTVV